MRPATRKARYIFSQFFVAWRCALWSPKRSWASSEFWGCTQRIEKGNKWRHNRLVFFPLTRSLDLARAEMAWKARLADALLIFCCQEAICLWESRVCVGCLNFSKFGFLSPSPHSTYPRYWSCRKWFRNVWIQDECLWNQLRTFMLYGPEGHVMFHVVARHVTSGKSCLNFWFNKLNHGCQERIKWICLGFKKLA